KTKTNLHKQEMVACMAHAVVADGGDHHTATIPVGNDTVRRHKRMGILGTLSLIPGFAYILALFVIGALVLPDRLKAAAADRIPATVGFHEIKDGGETRAKLSRAGGTRIL